MSATEAHELHIQSLVCIRIGDHVAALDKLQEALVIQWRHLRKTFITSVMISWYVVRMPPCAYLTNKFIVYYPELMQRCLGEG